MTVSWGGAGIEPGTTGLRLGALQLSHLSSFRAEFSEKAGSSNQLSNAPLQPDLSRIQLERRRVALQRVVRPESHQGKFKKPSHLPCGFLELQISSKIHYIHIQF